MKLKEMFDQAFAARSEVPASLTKDRLRRQMIIGGLTSLVVWLEAVATGLEASVGHDQNAVIQGFVALGFAGVTALHYQTAVETSALLTIETEAQAPLPPARRVPSLEAPQATPQPPQDAVPRTIAENQPPSDAIPEQVPHYPYPTEG